MDELHVALIVIMLTTLMILTVVLSRENKCADHQKDGYPGPGKCIGPGPKMGMSEPCCDPSNDLYNGDPDKKQCDYDSWGFEYKGRCVGYGRTRSECVDNCLGKADCVKNCPISYQAWAPSSCANKMDQ